MSGEPAPDTDPDFPSGEWTGFWLQNDGLGPAKYRQDLHLTFRQGVMSGAGSDAIGRFAIRGRYDAEEREAWWSKQYLGGHAVYYHGYREIKGIWGTWDIHGWTGGFHIWPRREGEELAESVAAEADVERVLEAPNRTPDYF